VEILTALGLAAPAGLNAPLVLLIVGIAGRFTGLVDLPADYDWIESWGALGGLGVWLAVEEVVDKIPGADHVNDAVNSALRPAAGAVVSLALTQGDLPPAVAGVLGVSLAGTTHLAKAAARPLVTVGTLGFGNPVVSAIEDAVAFCAAVIAILAPLLVVAVLAALVWALVALVRRRGRAAQENT
jgi:hypothetical protein